MTKKTEINRDKDFYLSKVNHTQEKFDNKEGMNTEKDNNTPLRYMHGGEWQVYPHTLSNKS